MSTRDPAGLLATDQEQLNAALALASEFTLPQLVAIALDAGNSELTRRLAGTLAAFQEEYLPGRFGRYSRHDLLLLQAAGRFIEVASNWQAPDNLDIHSSGLLRPYIPEAHDWEHSALFERLQSGQAPLPYPPPTSFGQPWYAIVEMPGVFPVAVTAAQRLGNGQHAELELNDCVWQVLAHVLPDGRELAGAPAVFRDDCRYIVSHGHWPAYCLSRGRTANRCEPAYAARLVAAGGDELHPSPRILDAEPDENGWVLLEYDHWVLQQRYPARDPQQDAAAIAADRQAMRQQRISLSFPLCRQRFEDADLSYAWDAEQPENSTVYRIRTMADQMRMSYPELVEWGDKALVIAAGLSKLSPAERDPDLFVRLYEYEQHADYMLGGAFSSLREASFMGGRFEDCYRQLLAGHHLQASR
ncbi:hypothetical protein [Chitinilyticum litopenaei]|uniref:hypothetical protein n=1 Tax=Chitinilyticum litopenaei TaxID=1121276 RepID=UPI0004163852|nr:hypothetical protein [Chitinilyticum litopenaei]